MRLVTRGRRRVERLAFGGQERSYAIFRPSGQSAGLVLALHPLGLTGRGMARVSHFDQFAERHGYTVVYPDGRGRRWDSAAGSDDGGFLLALLAELGAARFCLAGFSAGGAMAYRLASEAPGRVAALAVVSGGMPFTDCRPWGPLRLLIMHGTDDPVIPYEGGHQYGGGRWQPADWVAQFWSVEGNRVDFRAVEGGEHTWFRGASEACWKLFEDGGR